MKFRQTSRHRPERVAGGGLTRREFIPRVTVAALGAGILLNPDSSSGSVDNMKYRKLGKTGVSISEIGFGSHLTRHNMGDPRVRTAQIRKGLELGINLFDIYEHTSIPSPKWRICLFYLSAYDIWCIKMLSVHSIWYVFKMKITKSENGEGIGKGARVYGLCTRY